MTGGAREKSSAAAAAAVRRRWRKGGPGVPIAAQAHGVWFVCCARRAVVPGTGIIIIIIKLSVRRAPSSAYRLIRRNWHCTLCCDCGHCDCDDDDIDIRVRWPTVGGLRSTTTSAKRRLFCSQCCTYMELLYWHDDGAMNVREFYFIFVINCRRYTPRRENRY